MTRSSACWTARAVDSASECEYDDGACKRVFSLLHFADGINAIPPAPTRFYLFFFFLLLAFLTPFQRCVSSFGLAVACRGCDKARLSAQHEISFSCVESSSFAATLASACLTRRFPFKGHVV